MQCAPLTPKGHETGKKDRGGIVDEVDELRVKAGLIQRPKIAVVVAQRTHRDVGSAAADVVAAK